MNIPVDGQDRNIIPRWRDSLTTAATGELARIGAARPISENAFAAFEEKLQIWRIDSDVASAAEVVGAAIVLGKESDAIDAAEFLLANQTRAMPLVIDVARAVIVRSRSGLIEGKKINPAIDYRVVVRTLRERLSDDPRNVILRVDLARAYSILGNNQKASREMEIAVKQTRGNRFVLRSASRLWVHMGDPERAHDLFRGRDAVREDPWVMSAEIATASAAEQESKNIKRGIQLLTSPRFRPFDVGELASALGTVELGSGNSKGARRLLKQSLQDPTDNSVAQASWAAERISGIEIDPRVLDIPRTFEARAWQKYKEENWKDALNECRSWLCDEPFSSRPAQLGTFIAIVDLADYGIAEQMAVQGLQANPHDLILLNNLAVALAEQGDSEDALTYLDIAKQQPEATDIEQSIYLTATEGLIKYRLGDFQGGRTLYELAIKQATERGNRRAQHLATVHLAREEIRRQNFDESLLNSLDDIGKVEPDLQVFLQRVKALRSEIGRKSD